MAVLRKDQARDFTFTIRRLIGIVTELLWKWFLLLIKFPPHGVKFNYTPSEAALLSAWMFITIARTLYFAERTWIFLRPSIFRFLQTVQISLFGSHWPDPICVFNIVTPEYGPFTNLFENGFMCKQAIWFPTGEQFEANMSLILISLGQ